MKLILVGCICFLCSGYATYMVRVADWAHKDAAKRSLGEYESPMFLQSQALERDQYAKNK